MADAREYPLRTFGAMLFALLIISAGASREQCHAREYATYDLAVEYRVWAVKQQTDYALAANGAHASHLLPNHPEYGRTGHEKLVIDGRISECTLTSKWTPAPSGRYWLVIELPQARTVSAFSWYGEPIERIVWTYAPFEYDIRVSLDGKAWETVVEQRGPRVIQNVHVFDPMKAKYVAMAEIKSSNHFRGTTVFEVGVYDLTEPVPDASLDNPGWWDRNYRFRVRLNDASLGRTAGGVTRSVDFSDMLKSRMGRKEGEKPMPVDLSDIGVVRCTGDREQVVQECYPGTFAPDARFRFEDLAVGTLSWDAPGITGEQSWWLYVNVLDNETRQGAGGDESSVLTLDLPVWNFHRGSDISGEARIDASRLEAAPATLALALADGNGEYVKQEYPVVLREGQTGVIRFSVPTASVACGDYGLRFSVLDRDDNAFHRAEAGVSVVPRREHYMEFASYGFPEHSRLQAMRWARRMAEHNVTADLQVSGGAGADEATAVGMNTYPRGPNCGLYPTGQQLIVTKNGDTVPAGKRYVQGHCLNDPGGIRGICEALKKRARDLSRFGSFRGFTYFDDYAFPMIAKDGQQRWTCYCPYCKQRYHDRFRRPLPDMDAASWPSPIVPDDDPALLFIEERCRSMGDYVASLEKSKNEIDPSLEMGQMMMRNVYVENGMWPPYHFGRASVTSMYDYTTCSNILLGYFTLYELNQMGNRGKKAWMLFEGADLSKGYLKQEWGRPLPAWALRAGFWHNLAAGNKVLGMFGLWNALGKNAEFDREVRRLGALVKRIGPLLGQCNPVRSRVAVLASLPDFCRPDSPASHPRLGRVKKIHLALLQDGIPCEIVSDTEVSNGALSDYDVILVPDIEYIRRSAYEALADYAGKGGFVFVRHGCQVAIPGSRSMTVEEMIAEAAVHLQVRKRRIPANTGTRNAVYREFEMHGGRLLVVVNCETEASGQLGKFRWGQMEMIQAKPVELRMRIDGPYPYCYDLVEGMLLPRADDESILLRIAPGGGRILAAYERPIEQVMIHAGPGSLRRGAEAVLHLDMRGGGEVSRASHLVEIRVILPDGTTSREYSRIVLAGHGETDCHLPLAVNDPVGEWRVIVTELASGRTAETTLAVKR